MISKRNISMKPEVDLASTGPQLGTKARKRGRAGTLYADTTKPGQTGPGVKAKGVVVTPPRPRPLAAKKAVKPAKAAAVMAHKPTAAAKASKSARQ